MEQAIKGMPIRLKDQPEPSKTSISFDFESAPKLARIEKQRAAGRARPCARLKEHQGQQEGLPPYEGAFGGANRHQAG